MIVTVMRWVLVALMGTTVSSCSGCDRGRLVGSDEEASAAWGGDDSPARSPGAATVAAVVMGYLASARVLLEDGQTDEASLELRRARSLIDRFEEEKDDSPDPGDQKARLVLQRTRQHIVDASTAIDDSRLEDAEREISEAIAMAERMTVASVARSDHPKATPLRDLEEKAEKQLAKAKEQAAHRVRGARNALRTGHARLHRVLRHRGVELGR